MASVLCSAAHCVEGTSPVAVHLRTAVDRPTIMSKDGMAKSDSMMKKDSMSKDHMNKDHMKK